MLGGYICNNNETRENARTPYKIEVKIENLYLKLKF